jgi:hypothetical protein
VGYVLDGWGSIPGRGKRFFLTLVFKPALGPTKHSIQWILEALSMEGLSSWGMTLTIHLHLVLRTIIVQLCLRGMVLNSLCTGPTVTLPLSVISVKINFNFHTNILPHWH